MSAESTTSVISSICIQGMTLDDVLAICSQHVSWGEPITSLKQRNWLDDTPLHTVCTWGEPIAVKILIESGAEVNVQGDSGCTPLFHALVRGNLDVIQILLEHGADPRISNDWGCSPLQSAIQTDHYVIVAQMFKHAVEHLNALKIG